MAKKYSKYKTKLTKIIQVTIKEIEYIIHVAT